MTTNELNPRGVTIDEFCEAYHFADLRRADWNLPAIRGFHAVSREPGALTFQVAYVVRRDEVKLDMLVLGRGPDGVAGEA